MKAIVYAKYGSPSVVRLEEVDTPAYGDDDVLIKVRAASVNPLDWHFMRGEPYALRAMTGLRGPKIRRLGVDVAGEVEAVGKDVQEFKPGDAVFGGCRGAFAEFACTKEKELVLKPENVTFEQAAATPVAAFTSLQGLRDKGKIQAGQKVLINGAAGGVGTLAVQIAKSFGAEVTGVCSTRNVDVVRGLGADRVINYTQENFTKRRQRYDLIFDLVGNHPLTSLQRVLTPAGVYVSAGGTHGKWMLGAVARAVEAFALSRIRGQNLTSVLAKQSKADLQLVRQLMEDGRVKPVIDKRYRLTEVAEAIRYLEGGHAQGKVIIALEQA